jgi:leader peptidase (prepilin peptidase)/N-methyltransferase
MITARENIPVLSYLLQRGRCRHCGQSISIRYPLIEVATAILFALAAWKFDDSLLTALAYAAFFWVLVVLTVIDLEHQLLPNRIVYPSFVAGWALLTLAALVDGEASDLTGAALGALVFGGFLFVIAFIVPRGMGGGDAKLAFVLGTFLGFHGGLGLTLLGMFLSFLIGGVTGGIVAVVTKGGRKMKVPFGPFLAAGTVVAIFLGAPLLDWYLGTLS